jgi:toxin YoeB
MNKKYQIEYKEQFEADVLTHKKSGQKIIVQKIEKLINELKIHPRFGTGKPEHLKHHTIETWSRRITDKHRLVYQVQDEIVTVVVISGWGHYGDK